MNPEVHHHLGPSSLFNRSLSCGSVHVIPLLKKPDVDSGRRTVVSADLQLVGFFEAAGMICRLAASGLSQCVEAASWPAVCLSTETAVVKLLADTFRRSMATI